MCQNLCQFFPVFVKVTLFPTFTFIRITEVHFCFRTEIFLLQQPVLCNLQWMLLEQQRKHHNICNYSENIHYFCLFKSQFLINSAITRCRILMMCYCILYTNHNSIGLSQIFYLVLLQAAQIQPMKSLSYELFLSCDNFVCCLCHLECYLSASLYAVQFIDITTAHLFVVIRDTN